MENLQHCKKDLKPLKEFIRDPTLLSTHTVVVWIITDDLLTNPDPNLWPTLPFPDPLN